MLRAFAAALLGLTYLLVLAMAIGQVFLVKERMNAAHERDKMWHEHWSALYGSCPIGPCKAGQTRLYEDCMYVWNGSQWQLLKSAHRQDGRRL